MLPLNFGYTTKTAVNDVEDGDTLVHDNGDDIRNNDCDDSTEGGAFRHHRDKTGDTSRFPWPSYIFVPCLLAFPV